ncbi:MAG TPA: ATP-dependent DNA ligase [Flexivirga sp.]|uniref:ATP-dependent DNA ligase n=1 Tax=Flexivirga sp. TaxID=1962927 RepID=UPI002C0A23AE|nr:ATP-dependent DNA ligase [Flexivirga sp.]HWC21687.1 ATP-dependent DNA ligase [Flexivirga sp.]
MLLDQVISVSQAVRGTRSRLAKRDAVAQVLRDATPEEVPLVASYLAGVLPQRRIGVGWRGLRDAPEPSDDASVTVRELDETLSAVAAVRGAGSVGQRKELLATLFGRLTAAEQRFVTGLIQGELRQGAGDGVMLAAIAEASGVPEKAVRRAVMLAGFTAPVAAAAMNDGADAVAAIGLVVGRPMRPMLAGSATDIGGAIDEKLDQQVETKLDGIRVQAHKIEDEVRLFTRSLEEITDRLPEVVEIVQQLPAHRLVLDGEAVALTADGRPQPFQVTGARTASSADPARLRQETPVTPQFFDLLHLDGDDLIDLPFRERHRRLVDLVPARWLVAHAAVEDVDSARRFFDERVGAGDEGVVVKDLDAPYAAGRRGAGWVKVKPRHTLDLVVLAVEWGSGRRKGFLSNIHLGARDPETGGYVMLGKTFKGMTDEILRWQTERFTQLATDRGDWVVHVRPEQVVEIAFDGLQTSSRYPGGLALRFARVIRYRDDKRAEDADTIDTVRALAGP